MKDRHMTILADAIRESLSDLGTRLFNQAGLTPLRVEELVELHARTLAEHMNGQPKVDPVSTGLDDREINAILAGLRLLQYQFYPNDTRPGIMIIEDIFHGDDDEPLTDDEINALCERLNTE